MTNKAIMREPGRRPALSQTRLEIGTVLSYQPGTNRIDVRLSGAHHRVLRNVLIPAGAIFEKDDAVLICKVANRATWLAIVKIQNEDEFGLAISQVAGNTDLHPPSNLTVTGLPGFVFASWDAWPGAAVCFEIQANTTGTAGGGQEFTYGRNYLYPCDPPSRRYVRVRSLRYAPSQYQAYWSAWTDWAWAVPMMSTEQLVRQVDQLMGMVQELWTLHQLGEF